MSTPASSSQQPAHPGAGLVVAALALTVTGGLGVTAWRSLITVTSTRLRGDLLDDLALTVVAGVGAVIALWYALSALALVWAQLGRSTHVALSIARWGAPGLRRWAATIALTATGFTLGAPAMAAPTTAPDDLGWGAAQVSTSDTTSAATAHLPPPAQEPPSAGQPQPVSPAHAASRDSAASHAAAEPHAAAEVHTVQGGESLWSIAAAHLGPSATNAQIAESWQEWYATNREVIGENPHLILPGTTLTSPTS